MTQDLDFSDARKFQPGNHAGIVLDPFAKSGARRPVQLAWRFRVSERGNETVGEERIPV
jgi:hypothetical protein